MFLQGRRNLLYGWWVNMSPAMVGQWRKFLKLHWIKCLKTVSKKTKLGSENYSKPHIWSLLNSDFQVQSLSQHSPKTYLKYFQQTCPWLVPGKRFWLYFSEGVIFSQNEIIWPKKKKKKKKKKKIKKFGHLHEDISQRFHLYHK